MRPVRPVGLLAADVPARVERYVWGLTTGDDPLTAPTAAYHGKHARQFCRWLWRKKGLLDRDPLAGIDLPSQKTAAPRRDLSADELARVIAAAAGDPGVFRRLAGPDRAVLYLLAAATGYRSGELAVLTPANFNLAADVPAVRLPGKHTKNKKDAVQPLPPAVAERMWAYLADKPAGSPVWPGSWPDRAADMLRADLTRAGIDAVTGEGDAAFHSLRHTYTTMLGRTAPAKVVQELARHSSAELTVGRYSHAGLAEKAEAVARLPIPGADVGSPFARMTRPELEAVAESLAIVGLLGWAMVTPEMDTPKDDLERVGTKTPPSWKP